MNPRRTAALRAGIVASALVAGVVVGVAPAGATTGTLSVTPSSGSALSTATFNTSGTCPGVESVLVKVYGGSGSGATIAAPGINFVGSRAASDYGSPMTIPASFTWADWASSTASLSALNGAYTVKAVCQGGDTFVGHVTFTGVDTSGATYVEGLEVIPATPTGLTKVQSNSSVTVAWDAVSGATSYSATATRVSPAGSPVSCVVTGAANPRPSAACGGLANGSEYSIAVVASNGAGDSSPATIAATPRTTPGAPRSVAASILTASGGGKVKLSWAKPLSDGGNAIASYVVTASPKVGTATKTCTSSASARTCTVSGLKVGTAYAFSVVAQNAAGKGASATSDSVTQIAVAWTKSGKKMIGKFTAVKGATKHTVTVTGATRTSVTCAKSGTKVTCTVTLKAGTSVLTVKAVNGSGRVVGLSAPRTQKV